MSTVRVEGQEDLIRHLRRLADKYPELVEAEVRDALEYVVQFMASETQLRTPAGVGGAAGLRGSIFGEVRPVYGGLSGVWGTAAPYGEVVELGRRPKKGVPPLAPIALWARRILGLEPEEAEDAAESIRWKIYHYGTEGQFMFRDAWEENKDAISRKLQEVPGAVARKVREGWG